MEENAGWLFFLTLYWPVATKWIHCGRFFPSPPIFPAFMKTGNDVEVKREEKTSSLSLISEARATQFNCVTITNIRSYNEFSLFFRRF